MHYYASINQITMSFRFFVDNFFAILFGTSESVFTFVTLLEGKEGKNKKF